MKKATLLFLFVLQLSYSQGTQGAIYAGIDIAASAPELFATRSLVQTQREMITYTSIIAAEIITISQIDAAILESQTELQTFLGDLSAILHISITVNNIIQLQDAIIELSQESPQFIPLATRTQLKILSDAGYLMADLYIHSKESETNLLDNKARIDIINSTQDGLDALLQVSAKLYAFLSNPTIDINAEIEALNITQIITETQNETQTIIND